MNMLRAACSIILSVFTSICAAQFPPPAPAAREAVKIVRTDSLDKITVSEEEVTNYLATTANKEIGLALAKKIVLNAKRRVYMGLADNYSDALKGAEVLEVRRDMVDRIVIVKHERKLYLKKGERIVKTFPIALGPDPVGQKEREGDGKTPEGIYTLDWRKYEGNVIKSFHISYPNAEDIARAKKKGLTPGSNIMIHGTTPGPKKKKDWTNGCIGLTNAHMIELSKIVFQDTVVEIVK